MNQTHESVTTLWGPERVKPTPKELVAKFVAESNCRVCFNGDRSCPTELKIEFSGALSRIPSLKNSKLPGKNFLNPDVTSRLKAMTILFERTFPTTQCWDGAIYLTFMAAPRTRTFDLIGCLESIQDWLEPRKRFVKTKQIWRDRGWGIGLIQNDSQIRPRAIPYSDLSGLNDRSTIILQRWRQALPHKFICPIETAEEQWTKW